MSEIFGRFWTMMASVAMFGFLAQMHGHLPPRHVGTEPTDDDAKWTPSSLETDIPTQVRIARNTPVPAPHLPDQDPTELPLSAMQSSPARRPTLPPELLLSIMKATLELYERSWDRQYFRLFTLSLVSKEFRQLASAVDADVLAVKGNLGCSTLPTHGAERVKRLFVECQVCDGCKVFAALALRMSQFDQVEDLELRLIPHTTCEPSDVMRHVHSGKRNNLARNVPFFPRLLRFCVDNGFKSNEWLHKVLQECDSLQHLEIGIVSGRDLAVTPGYPFKLRSLTLLSQRMETEPTFLNKLLITGDKMTLSLVFWPKESLWLGVSYTVRRLELQLLDKRIMQCHGWQQLEELACQVYDLSSVDCAIAFFQQRVSLGRLHLKSALDTISRNALIQIVPHLPRLEHFGVGRRRNRWIYQQPGHRLSKAYRRFVEEEEEAFASAMSEACSAAGQPLHWLDLSLLVSAPALSTDAAQPAYRLRHA